ncbi:Na+/H+ antiporter subunit G [Roseicitreum antarcticum]|uniref:Multisubunit potassium/proton antiporter, PhaG subunit n=1 Tax=Roseicitreum antarcticum TaxID=564137 RepID=A0A1H2RQI8_9RHOB|nr:Na+/H+ antiporter subunit G [Roseicitreum antarcticum]SDW21716.1 multisubunit potassium/proton antiporter, PhaG subunit [Roseicitreum antarcticum]
MAFVAELIVALMLVVAGIFGLVGSFGLVKLPDAMTRLHAPTKATTVGVGGVLIASMLHSLMFGAGLSFHELMITLFLFLTAPITAHFIAKAQLHRHVSQHETSKPVGDAHWAGYQPVPEVSDAPKTP